MFNMQFFFRNINPMLYGAQNDIIADNSCPIKAKYSRIPSSESHTFPK